MDSAIFSSELWHEMILEEQKSTAPVEWKTAVFSALSANLLPCEQLNNNCRKKLPEPTEEDISDWWLQKLICQSAYQTQTWL